MITLYLRVMLAFYLLIQSRSRGAGRDVPFGNPCHNEFVVVAESVVGWFGCSTSDILGQDGDSNSTTGKVLAELECDP